MHNNEKKQNLEKCKGKYNKYIFIPFIISYPFFQKESNCSTDLSKQINCFNNLVYIQKISQSKKC